MLSCNFCKVYIFVVPPFGKMLIKVKSLPRHTFGSEEFSCKVMTSRSSLMLS